MVRCEVGDMAEQLLSKHVFFLHVLLIYVWELQVQEEYLLLSPTKCF